MIRPATVLAATAAALLVLSGCSSQEAPPVSAPVAPVATPEATASPAAAAPAGTATTRSAPSAVSEQANSAPENEDGITFGVVTAVGADRVLRYDKVDYLERRCDQRTESQFGDEPATLRICFRNVNPRVRTVRVTQNVTFGDYLSDGSQQPDPYRTWADFRTSFEEDQPRGLLPHALTIEGGIVTRIDRLALLAG
jgi:hypothetical protein